MQLETIHWHTLASEFLDSNSRVLDLGANYGLFARAITDRFGCECVAVEPSPVPFAGIKTSRLISKLRVAVGGNSGRMHFHVDPENGLASALTDGDGDLETRVATLPQIFDEIGWRTIDLLKVDIEGAEIGILAACPDEFLTKRIKQISIEFHDFCGVTPADVVESTLNRLRLLRFESVRMSRIGHQDTLLINTRLLPNVSAFDILFARQVTRNWLGLKRVVGRIRVRLREPMRRKLRRRLDL